MQSPSVIPRCAASILLFAVASVVVAHGGGRDASGCHNNRKTGEYHCHRGASKGESILPREAMLGGGGSTREPARETAAESASDESAVPRARRKSEHATSHPRVYKGKVVGITDGDTLTILVDDRPVKVRLSEIDTPEHGQAFGTKAKQALSDLAFGMVARVAHVDTDRYGRLVGRVYVGETDVNAELVRQGHAWAYRQYLRDEGILKLEEAARADQRGLWVDPHPVPPWQWRRGARTPQTVTTTATTPATPSGGTLPTPQSFTCGATRYCGQMGSCLEARFHFEQCGLTRLDADGDGVPCEQMCR